MRSQFLMEVGNRLLEERMKMGITQTAMAKILGIAPSYYGEIERGNRTLSVDKLVLLYEKTGIEPTYILLGKILTNKRIADFWASVPKAKEKEVMDILQRLMKLAADKPGNNARPKK